MKALVRNICELTSDSGLSQLEGMSNKELKEKKRSAATNMTLTVALWIGVLSVIITNSGAKPAVLVLFFASVVATVLMAFWQYKKVAAAIDKYLN